MGGANGQLDAGVWSLEFGEFGASDENFGVYLLKRHHDTPLTMWLKPLELIPQSAGH